MLMMSHYFSFCSFMSQKIMISLFYLVHRNSRMIRYPHLTLRYCIRSTERARTVIINNTVPGTVLVKLQTNCTVCNSHTHIEHTSYVVSHYKHKHITFFLSPPTIITARPAAVSVNDAVANNNNSNNHNELLAQHNATLHNTSNYFKRNNSTESQYNCFIFDT